MSEIKDERKRFISQNALDERKKILRFIKGEQRAINECENNIGIFERRIHTIKNHPRYQSEDGTISIRQKRSLKIAEETGEAQKCIMISKGYDMSGVCVSEFRITWSLKKRKQP